MQVIKAKSYLTEMKELPTEEAEKVEHKKAPVVPAAPKPEVSDRVHISPPDAEKPISTNKTPNEEIQLASSPFGAKDIILGIINIILISATLFIVFVSLPAKSLEYNKLKFDILKNDAGVTAQKNELEPHTDRAEDLAGLFLDESGVVDFVKAVEDIKKEEPVIVKLTIPNQKAVKDKTGMYGIPVAIEMRGTWQEIDRALQKINTLPYLFRAAKFDVAPPRTVTSTGETIVVNPNVLDVTYGGLLYAKEELAKN